MTFDLQPELVGELVELRPLQADDYDGLFAVASDPLIWEQHPVKTRCQLEGFRAFFDESLTSGGALVVVDRKSQQIVGSSRYHRYHADASEIEIGWTFLARSHWGGRYNGEMKRLMLQHAFRFVRSVVFLVGPDNIRSQRAVEKIGAVRDGSRPDSGGRESYVYRATASRLSRCDLEEHFSCPVHECPLDCHAEHGRLLNGTLCLLLPQTTRCIADEQRAAAPAADAHTATERREPAYLTADEFTIEGLPQQHYHLEIDYEYGRARRINLAGSVGYVIRPTDRVDAQRRWVWIVPLWLALPSAHGNHIARHYVEGLLDDGFHVVGFDVGASLGSPKGAELFGIFHDHVVEEYNLAPKARMLAVSNGGLITYGYAFRNPERIDRILGIYPALDFRSWPEFHRVVGPAAIAPAGLAYELTPAELIAKIEQYNPIDNLKPLTEAGVPLLHIHGDADELVPLEPNSQVAAERYHEFGGDFELKVLPGKGHGGTEFFTDAHALEFLLGEPSDDDRDSDR